MTYIPTIYFFKVLEAVLEAEENNLNLDEGICRAGDQRDICQVIAI